jgi:hypothetical protein
MTSQKYLGNKFMILSSLLILTLVVASGILLSSMLLPFQLPRVSADSSDANTDQDLKQKNTGSGDSDNFNCGENLIDSAVSVICLAEPPPPPPETATLSVCKEVTGGTGGGTFPADFAFIVTGNNPFPAQFTGDNSDGCVDVTIGPGEYIVSEVSPPLGGRTLTVSIEGECMQDLTNRLRATGVIDAGETQVCTFINSFGD